MLPLRISFLLVFLRIFLTVLPLRIFSNDVFVHGFVLRMCIYRCFLRVVYLRAFLTEFLFTDLSYQFFIYGLFSRRVEKRDVHGIDRTLRIEPI